VLAKISQSGQIGDENLACLKHILLTGETLSPTLAQRWMNAYPSTYLYNVYGTTETAIISHWYTLPRILDPEKPVPVGEVLPGMRVALMDGNVPVANGETGESVVMGAQISCGYWRNDAENAARFVPNLDNTDLPQMAYRTGDLLSKDSDGLYEFKGRKDNQVKVRGHRVELNEVELAILPFPGIDEAAVLLNKDEERPDEAHLVGFLATPEEVDAAKLTAYLQKKMPSYMVPSLFIRKPEGLPKNSNQKIDRQALKLELRN
jgi:acyl-coenzyme A synthetase/AMP-(fatty) acid ligase